MAVVSLNNVLEDHLKIYNNIGLNEIKFFIDGLQDIIDSQEKMVHEGIFSLIIKLMQQKDELLIKQAKEVKFEGLYDHSWNVKEHSGRFFRFLYKNQRQIEDDDLKEDIKKLYGIGGKATVYNSALLHDIYKLLIPNWILLDKNNFEEKSNGYEKTIIEQHPVAGAKIIDLIKDLERFAEFVKYHHEGFTNYGVNGRTPYPGELTGRDIPLCSRIISLVDDFISRISDRPYNSKMSVEEYIIRLEEDSRGKLDPSLVKMFPKYLEKFSKNGSYEVPLNKTIHTV